MWNAILALPVDIKEDFVEPGLNPRLPLQIALHRFRDDPKPIWMRIARGRSTPQRRRVADRREMDPRRLHSGGADRT
mgnify:CR=1 FL=1